MKIFWKYYRAAAGFMYWCLLCIIRKDPHIRFFKSESNIAINDLPQFITWKTKNAWKVEIREIGRVKRKDHVILNNKQHRDALTLIAYGRNKMKTEVVLVLNRKDVRLEKTKEPGFSSYKQQTVPQQITTVSLTAQVEQMQQSFKDAFYTIQDCSATESLLKKIIMPQRCNSYSGSIEQLINESAQNLENFYSDNYQSALNHHIQNKNSNHGHQDTA